MQPGFVNHTKPHRRPVKVPLSLLPTVNLRGNNSRMNKTIRDAFVEAIQKSGEGMTIACAKGKLRGKQPKLSEKQQKELGRMHATGEYSISDLAELFSVSRPTVYRALNRIRAV